MKNKSMYETSTGTKMKRVGVVLSYRIYDELKRTAFESGMTIQDYIRVMVDNVIAENKKGNAC